MASFIRRAVVAGAFYPSDKNELIKAIEHAYKTGVKKLPYKKRDNESIKGMITPHAGYLYSGATASHAYYELSKHKPKTFIILGPNHSGMSTESISVMTNGVWETPLGRVNVDRNIGERVCNAISKQPDFMPHLNEHSIEVQLPFLQHLYEEVNIVPIAISGATLEELKALGSALSEEDSVIIASSDFTHHGKSYDYNIFKNVETDMYDYDMKAMKLIQEYKINEFHALGERSTICGYQGITALMQAMNELRVKPKFLKYGTSAEVTSDYSNVVGYASMIFK